MSCPDYDAVSAALNSALAGPKRVTNGVAEVEQQSLADLIKADQYLAAKCAAGSRRRGLRFNRLVPDGTVARPTYPWRNGNFR